MSFCRTTVYIAMAAHFAVSADAAADMRVAMTLRTITADQQEGFLATAATPAPSNAPQSHSAPEAPTAPGPAGANEPSGNPLWAIPLKSLSFTRERPLFTPSRRPPAPVAY